LHAIPTVNNYDIEFGGFTKKLTREICSVLAPGQYTVKIVIQDVADQRVDAGVFIETDSLKLFSFLAADFDVDGGDFLIWQQNYGANATPNPRFTDGDADGNGLITLQDFFILAGSYGQSGGNKQLCADFNRDNNVNGADFLIWQQNNGLSQCGSRFEGDANDDGAVDSADLAIWNLEFGDTPSGMCGCEGGEEEEEEEEEEESLAGGGWSTRTTRELVDSDKSVDHPADRDGDGDFDRADLELWGEHYKSLAQ